MAEFVKLATQGTIWMQKPKFVISMYAIVSLETEQRDWIVLNITVQNAKIAVNGNRIIWMMMVIAMENVYVKMVTLITLMLVVEVEISDV